MTAPQRRPILPTPAAQATLDRVMVWYAIAFGIGMVGLVAAIFVYVGWARLGPGHELRDAAVRVEDVASPSIADVRVEHDLLVITLVTDSLDAVARDVWCDVALPTGLGVASIAVTSDDPPGAWDAPRRCEDPRDEPAFRPSAGAP